MGKIQNTFSRATIQKDLDGRFLQNNELTDAENFLVSTSEGDGAGVGKNVLGNIKRMVLEDERVTDFSGAITIGVGKDEANNKIYNFIKADLYDCIVEYDTETSAVEFVAICTTGSTLNFQAGERITNVDVIINGESDVKLLAWSGDSNPPRIMNIEWGKNRAVDDFTEDEISLMKPSPIFSPVINTVLVPLQTDNFLEDRFLRFAYRYKYRDGYYSAPSSWSDVAFTPKEFELDYQTYENKGMLNLANAVNVTFNYGPREVVEVELLFKESQKNTIYVSQNFIKNTDGSDDDTEHTFQVNRSKIFKILSSDQLTRNFDNVPLKTIAQTTIAGRLAYANYLEGRDIDTVIDFTAECESTSPFTGTTVALTADKVLASVQSNVVDFQRKTVVGGTSPTDYMDFTTNNIAIPLSLGEYADLDIIVTPEPDYNTTTYNITVKDSGTVIQTWTGLTGTQTRSFTALYELPDVVNTKNIKVYVTSSSGFIYACETDVKRYNSSSTLTSSYKYFSDYQYSFPKAGGYGSTLEGDVVQTGKVVIDFTGYEFTKGKQLRINYDMISTLVDMTQPPSVTFFYNITENYADLDDFMLNSSFKPQLEDVFSDLFINGVDGNGGFSSGAGSLVSSQGFVASNTGDALTIDNPFVVYSVTEPSTAVVNKTEFYINTEVTCESLTNNSYASQHSNRDYEICMIYLDDKGRKTTALIDKENTYHVPAENSVLINMPKVTVNHDPPSWAKYYKFGVKSTKTSYETIYGNVLYKEDIYRWVKLVGENKNKVKEGDILTVKTDFRGPLITVKKVKVLEISVKDKDFIPDNVMANNKPLIEEPGLYMKIKQGDFDMNIDEDSFKSYGGFLKRRYASESWVLTSPDFGEYDESNVWVPDALKAGSQINFFVEMKMMKQPAFTHAFDRKYIVTKDYDSVYDWFQDVVADDDAWQTYLEHPDLMTFPNPITYEFQGADNNRFAIRPWRNGTASHDMITTVRFDVNFAGGNVVFETEPFEDLSAPFYETPEVFTITGGAHEFTEHILTGAANCYAYGNGVESWKIQDSFVGKTFGLDANPTEVNKEGYKQIHRFADITYSEPYNSNSNINRLNEFNLSLANFKDDIEKSYGPIYKIKGMDDNLQVFQQDKDSQVMYGTDILYNADGTGNLSKISSVLGSQNTYAGDYGISSHPDSFDVYGFDTYHTDVKRGVVIKKSNNGLFEVSKQGMRSYFKKLFSKNTLIRVNGKYDSYNDFYVLNIKYHDVALDEEKFVTWIYSDKDNGWLGRLNFNPEDMVNVNGKFFAFKNGEIYEHNQDGEYNTFFGVESPSKATFNFSQNPSERKQYKTFEIEGTVPVDITATTDMGAGYVNKEDFDKVENVFYAYVRTSNDTIDTSLLSCQGIGKVLGISGGNVISFGFVINDTVSVGDIILNADMEVVGTVMSKTPTEMLMTTVDNIVVGDYVLSAKPQSVENSHLLGYHCEVNLEFSSTDPQEIYAVNSEVSKSFY